MKTTPGQKLLSAVFLLGGVLHFVLTPTYLKIMPPYLSQPRILVEISGLCEVLGGIGLLLPQTRKASAWGLVALLVAVMPANVYMAMDHARWPSIPTWLLWARLPLQLPLIWWAWCYTRAASPRYRPRVWR